MKDRVSEGRKKEQKPPSKELTSLQHELEHVAKTAESADNLMRSVARMLNERKLYYNWVGFYLISKTEPNWLELGPFVGAMTPHSRIAMNQGLCGAAASSGKTIVVADVGKDPRYLACSVETKSEIVAPIFARGKVVGELDIDSFIPAAFQHEDQELVEFSAALIGDFLERQNEGPRNPAVGN
jgi:GAF domain-containing protein